MREEKTDAPFNVGIGNNPLYNSLYGVLTRAYDRAANGKGKARHANGEAFENQPIMTIAEKCGIGFLSGQAVKKIWEFPRIIEERDTQSGVNELLDAIVYLSACVLHIERKTDILSEADKKRWPELLNAMPGQAVRITDE